MSLKDPSYDPVAEDVLQHLTEDQIISACYADDMLAYCIACGEEHQPLEPDARRVKCDACGVCAVYGAEELLVRIVA